MNKRRFALPAAIAAGLVAAVLFGFRTPLRSTKAAVALRAPENPAVLQYTVSPDSDQTGGADRDHTDAERPTQPEPPSRPITSPISVVVPRPIAQTSTDIARISPEPPGLPGKGYGEGSDAIIDATLLDHAPQAKVQPPPIYPADAREAGITGTVMVEFIVDPSGQVTTAWIVSSTDPVFEQATLQAVRHWRFQPGRHNGRPVAFRLTVPVRFSLDSN